MCKFLSHDVASVSDITPCNKIDKPLTGNVMTSIITLRKIREYLEFYERSLGTEFNSRLGVTHVTSKNGITKHVWYSTPIPMSTTECRY